MQLECESNEALTVAGPRKISVKQLKELGYKLTDNQITTGKPPYKYGVLEIRNEEGNNRNKEVGFSLLYSTDDKLGVILPNPYSYYVSRPSSAFSGVTRR